MDDDFILTVAADAIIIYCQDFSFKTKAFVPLVLEAVAPQGS